MTLLFSDPIFLKHDTGPHHPERIGRLQAILARLEQTGLAARCGRGAISPLAEGDVTRVHTCDVLAAIHDAIAMGGAHVDPDTVVCPDSLDVALAAAGAACAAVSAVLTGGDPTALCLVRPPGHHATPT